MGMFRNDTHSICNKHMEAPALVNNVFENYFRIWPEHGIYDMQIQLLSQVCLNFHSKYRSLEFQPRNRTGFQRGNTTFTHYQLNINFSLPIDTSQVSTTPVCLWWCKIDATWLMHHQRGEAWYTWKTWLCLRWSETETRHSTCLNYLRVPFHPMTVFTV